ncbi:MAG TPA: hypothetical protein VFE15_10735 [Marmoricola sp.]|jgi:hypothetical protein|nr:hypothetical protein [Marmoricola sp.]
MNVARTLLPLAVAALVLAPVAAADARPASLPDRATTTDILHDVAAYQIGSSVPTKVPTRTNGDLRVVRVTHTASRVRIATTFVDLSPGGNLQEHDFAIRTPKALYDAEVFAVPGHWRGSAALSRGNRQRSCPKMTSTIDYTKNTTVLVVPTSCLGAPRWIRAGAGMTIVSGTTQYADDGLSGTAGDVLTIGPKLYP